MSPSLAGQDNPQQLQIRLIRRVAEDRDRDCFRLLFEHFAPRIKALMLRSGSQHSLAEDLVQDVMLTVWHKSSLYSPERGSVSSWVFTIARNARTDRLRLKSSQPYVDVSTLEIASEAGNGEDAAGAAQEADRVGAALAELPDDQKRIIELAYVEGLSQTAIAEQLGIPLGTVKSRMRLAYAKLRDSLEALR